VTDIGIELEPICKW